MKKFIPAALILTAVFGVLAGAWFFSGNESVRRYGFSLEGDYAPREIITSLKKGVAIFSISDKAKFLVKSETGRFYGSVDPWGDIMFLSVFDPLTGETKRLSASKCKILSLTNREVKIRVQYNSEYFNPLVDKVWTGIGEGGDFKPASIRFEMRNITNGDYRKNIADLEDLPTPEPDTLLKAESEPKSGKAVYEKRAAGKLEQSFRQIFDSGVLVMNRALGTEPESRANQDFWEVKLPEKEVKEIKERIFGAWSVGERLVKK